MQRLAWATDIHLDFLSPEQIKSFGARVAQSGAHAVVITGDISVAPRLGIDLARLVNAVRMPVYFVAGNHDYYGASVAAVRRALTGIRDVEPRLVWLPRAGVIRLSSRTALIGVDGWGDARLGNPMTTPILFNDHRQIADLVHPTRDALVAAAQRLGEAEARTLERLLGEALPHCDELLVATHIPPFAEATTHQGMETGADWLPWMTCDAVGQVLRRAAQAYPGRRITVLAGHTHDRAQVDVLQNLRVMTGAAEYGAPALERVVEVL